MNEMQVAEYLTSRRIWVEEALEKALATASQICPAAQVLSVCWLL